MSSSSSSSSSVGRGFLESLRVRIENLSKEAHYNFFEILVRHNVTINENKHGSLINLSCLSEEVIHDLDKCMLKYEALEKVEREKKELFHKFVASKKDPTLIIPQPQVMSSASSASACAVSASE